MLLLPKQSWCPSGRGHWQRCSIPRQYSPKLGWILLGYPEECAFSHRHYQLKGQIFIACNFTDSMTILLKHAFVWMVSTSQLKQNFTSLGQIFINTLWPERNGCRFAHNIFKYIFVNSWNIFHGLIKMLPTTDKSTLVQVMAWRWTGDKPWP